MQSLSRLASSVVVMLIVLGAGPVSANLFVSGDSNITNPLTGSFGAGIDAGNRQFFSNILQGGTSVAVLDGDPGWIVFAEDLDNYYDSLSGVDSSRFSGTVTSAQLAGIDLFLVPLPADEFAGPEIAVMQSFLTGGGSIFFLGENSNFSESNARINGALSDLGSSLSIVGNTFDSGWHTATGSQIASDPFTAGVTTFSYAAVSGVTVGSEGTMLFYGTNGTGFLAYETTVVPVPSAVLLAMFGLSVAGARLRKAKA